MILLSLHDVRKVEAKFRLVEYFEEFLYSSKLFGSTVKIPKLIQIAKLFRLRIGAFYIT